MILQKFQGTSELIECGYNEVVPKVRDAGEPDDFNNLSELVLGEGESGLRWQVRSHIGGLLVGKEGLSRGLELVSSCVSTTVT